jgi:hypothetical protein
MGVMKSKFRVNLSSEELDRFCKETKFEREVKKKPIIKINLKEDWRKYRCLCWRITLKNNLDELKNYDKRINKKMIETYGFKILHSYEFFTLDHKISIWQGWKQKLDPYFIGSIENLEYIPSKLNCLKGRKTVLQSINNRD